MVTSKAERYAAAVVEENYFPTITTPWIWDEVVDASVRYRDIKAWLMQGYEAGRRECLRELGA